MDYNKLAETIGIIAAYSGVGIAMLAVGFVVMDLIIPGKLRHQIWHERNVNCTAIAASAMLSLGIIVAVSIRAANGELAEGLQQVVAFSGLGVILLAVAFFLVDILTPGDLGKMIAETRYHPATTISVVTNFVIAIIISAAIF